MKKIEILIAAFLLVIVCFTGVSAEISVKIKNLCIIDGYKVNQVYGYGLVAGLSGTGDSRSTLTKESMKNLLNSMGIQSADPVIKNIAAVMITADLPPHVRVGDKCDVTVSSVGDAKSLEGGILIQSPLKGADGVVYVVSQGRVSIGTSSGRGKTVKTSAVVTGGGVVEREIKPSFLKEDKDKNEYISLILKKWDYSTADRIIKAVKKTNPDLYVRLSENGKISVQVKKDLPLSEFISKIESISVIPDYRATVIVNQRDGIVVTGGEVSIGEAMISRKGMTVEIEGSDMKRNVSLIKESATVKELVETLNTIGASTDDIISILKALRDSGALHADLIIK